MKQIKPLPKTIAPKASERFELVQIARNDFAAVYEQSRGGMDRATVTGSSCVPIAGNRVNGLSILAKLDASHGAAQKAARQDQVVEWSEVSEEKYFEMLEVLPPAAMTGRGFLVGEPWDHHALSGQPRFAAFISKAGKFFESSRPLTLKEFKAL